MVRRLVGVFLVRLSFWAADRSVLFGQVHPYGDLAFSSGYWQGRAEMAEATAGLAEASPDDVQAALSKLCYLAAEFPGVAETFPSEWVNPNV